MKTPPSQINDLTYRIRGAAFKVHTQLGPGLIESVYETCLAYELAGMGLQVERQKHLPVAYDGIYLDTGYRIDLLVNDAVIVELKAKKAITDVDIAQLLTYLKLSDKRVGLLMNFNVAQMKDGIKRFVNSANSSKAA